MKDFVCLICSLIDDLEARSTSFNALGTVMIHGHCYRQKEGNDVLSQSSAWSYSNGYIFSLDFRKRIDQSAT